MSDFRKLLDDLETAAWRAMTAAKRNSEELAPELRKVFVCIEELVDEYERTETLIDRYEDGLEE